MTPEQFKHIVALGIQYNPNKNLRIYTSMWAAISVEDVYEPTLPLEPSDKIGFCVAAFESLKTRIEIQLDSAVPEGTIIVVPY